MQVNMANVVPIFAFFKQINPICKKHNNSVSCLVTRLPYDGCYKSSVYLHCASTYKTGLSRNYKV